MPGSKKKASAEPETATISYHKGDDAERVEIAVPVQPGSGERLINRAERAGADVEYVREQVKNLPQAER